jgi:3-deoxy-D-manno-octulosonic-acid transferase
VLQLLRPWRLILIEGELWPNLLSACIESNVPVMIANARLSPRSASRFTQFGTWTSPFFSTLAWVGIPDEADRERWEAVGVPSERIQLTGSVKFDSSQPDETRPQLFENLLRHSGLRTGEPVIVAGSTHNGEETILVQALKKWRSTHPTLRLLIAPRHVERIPDSLRELTTMGVKILKRSALPSQEPWDVILLDTTGELRDWYPLSSIAFIGKSLTAKGGQNPVEPALCGKAVLFGPHMENFESIVNLLLTHDGALQASSVYHMEELVECLLSDEGRRRQLGHNARAALHQHQGAAQRTARQVMQIRIVQ